MGPDPVALLGVELSRSLPSGHLGTERGVEPVVDRVVRFGGRLEQVRHRSLDVTPFHVLPDPFAPRFGDGPPAPSLGENGQEPVGQPIAHASA